MYAKIDGAYKQPKANKPWWDGELTLKWKEQCIAERNWKKLKNGNIKLMQNNFVKSRKEFDRLYQKKRRQWMSNEKEKLYKAMKENSREFWKKIDQIGIGNERNKYPGQEVKLDTGKITSDRKEVLKKWEDDFKSLFIEKDITDFDDNFLRESELFLEQHDKGISQQNVMDAEDEWNLNSEITYDEVSRSVLRAKLRKASGIDEIPTEVLQNTTVISFLTTLFQQCFKKGMVPGAWKKNIITPIPKGASTNPLIPLTHRGLHLLSSVCKVYCDILNIRLNKWAENQNKIAEEQNGFRRQRSCLDHLYILTSIAKDRLQHKKQLYCCYVDAKKAFDKVNRSLLWRHLIDQGINGKFLGALRAMYSGYQCCVRVQGCLTKMFNAPIGVKQGCRISPLLFGLYINSLAEKIKDLNKGAKYGDKNIGLLLYADDVVILSDTAEGLQEQLNALNDWCKKWRLELNGSKTSIMIYRNKGTELPTHQFNCGNLNLDYVEEYKYLGLYLNSHMCWSRTVNYLAKSASKALGVLIAKDKAFGGMDYGTYTHLYNTCVRPILEYGSELWGKSKCETIENIYHRAMKYHLKLGKTAPNDAVEGDMGWSPPSVRNNANRIRYYCKLKGMSEDRLPHHVFRHQTVDNLRKNWRKDTEVTIAAINEQRLFNLGQCGKYTIRKIVKECHNKLFQDYKDQWKNRIMNDNRSSNVLYKNKLRTYRTFKETYNTEDYLKVNINEKYRRTYIQFRAGVAPINIEVLRYAKNKYIPANQRFCEVCDVKAIEDEMHLLCNCLAYNDVRDNLYDEVTHNYADFVKLNNNEQFVYLMSDATCFKPVAKALYHMMMKRTDILYINYNNECVNNVNFNTVSHRSNGPASCEGETIINK